MRIRMITLLAAVASISLAACSQGSDATDSASPEAAAIEAAESADPANVEALNNYIAFEQQSVDAIIGSETGSMYQSINVAGNATADVLRETVTYTYATQQPAEALDALASGLSSNFQGFESQVFPMMRNFGMTGVLQGEYIYNNADGTPIWSQVFMQDADGNVCSFDPFPVDESPLSCADIN